MAEIIPDLTQTKLPNNQYKLLQKKKKKKKEKQQDTYADLI